jgi:hypothetical protein
MIGAVDLGNIGGALVSRRLARSLALIEVAHPAAQAADLQRFLGMRSELGACLAIEKELTI